MPFFFLSLPAAVRFDFTRLSVVIFSAGDRRKSRGNRALEIAFNWGVLLDAITRFVFDRSAAGKNAPVDCRLNINVKAAEPRHRRARRVAVPVTPRSIYYSRIASRVTYRPKQNCHFSRSEQEVRANKETRSAREGGDQPRDAKGRASSQDASVLCGLRISRVNLR